MSTSPRRWNGISITAGLAIGIPLGVIGLISAFFRLEKALEMSS